MLKKNGFFLDTSQYVSEKLLMDEGEVYIARGP